MQVLRNFFDFPRTCASLRPIGAIRPDVNSPDGPEISLADDFDRRAQSVACCSLVPHLSAKSLFGRQFTHQARFGDRIRQRFLTEAMLAQFHGADRCGSVRVIRRADSHRIDFVRHFVEHLAIIDVLSGLGKPLSGSFQVFLVDIAQCDNVAVAPGVIAIAGPFAVDADAGESDHGIRGLFLGPCPAGRSDPATAVASSPTTAAGTVGDWVDESFHALPCAGKPQPERTQRQRCEIWNKHTILSELPKSSQAKFFAKAEIERLLHLLSFVRLTSLTSLQSFRKESPKTPNRSAIPHTVKLELI